jgi:hypothetical protein
MRLSKVAAFARQLGPSDSRSAPPQRERAVKPNEPDEQRVSPTSSAKDWTSRRWLRSSVRQFRCFGVGYGSPPRSAPPPSPFVLPPALGPAGREASSATAGRWVSDQGPLD